MCSHFSRPMEFNCDGPAHRQQEHRKSKMRQRLSHIQYVYMCLLCILFGLIEVFIVFDLFICLHVSNLSIQMVYIYILYLYCGQGTVNM